MNNLILSIGWIKNKIIGDHFSLKYFLRVHYFKGDHMKLIIVLMSLLLSFEVLAKNIAIIGGGIAGVSTAYFLKDTGHSVDVFEASAKLGGNADTRFIQTGIGDSKVPVDIGPQYLSLEGWKNYLGLLRDLNILSPSDLYEFKSSLTIHQSDSIQLTTKFLCHPSPQNFLNIVELLRFQRKAHQFFQAGGSTRDMDFYSWKEKYRFNKKRTTDFLDPLIASMRNAEIDEIDNLSMLGISGMAAPVKPVKSLKYVGLKEGMQSFIFKIAHKVKNENIKFFTNSKVTSLSKIGMSYQLGIHHKIQNKLYDYVIVATDPLAAKNFFSYESSFEKIIPILDQFRFSPVTVYIHKNHQLLHPNCSTFYNVNTREDGSYSVSMKLNEIHPSYGHLIKSFYLTQAEIDELYANNLVLEKRTFYHPVYDLDFIKSQLHLHKTTDAFGNLFFVGSWTRPYETHDTAVQSAFIAASKIAPEFQSTWIRRIPSLRHISAKH
jgi:predicted NAD/FAD-binding protein